MVCKLVFLLTVIALSVAVASVFRPALRGNRNTLRPHDLGPMRHHGRIRNMFGNLFSYPDTYRDMDTHDDYPFNTSNPTIFVTEYGADPSGEMDSTAAIQHAISVAMTRGSANAILSNGIHDCGGALIHLEGGDYLISKPLIIPQYYGNLRMVFGTIRASADFSPSSSGYLLIVGDNRENACNNSQHSCNENIGIENVMFDSSHLVFGGLHIIAAMGIVVGPQVFFLGFTGIGIAINGGHETMVSQTWMGEYLYSSADYLKAESTAILLNGNDHYITNTIVFSAKIGVHIKNNANLLNGVHTWNMNTNDGGIGILIESHNSRLIGCYLDGNDLILTAPIQAISQKDGFFLGDGSVVLRAKGAASVVSGLVIAGNTFLNGNSKPILCLDESNGQFTNVSEMVVEHNMLQSKRRYKQPRFSAVLTQSGQSLFKFEFASDLLFDCGKIPIAWIDYSVQFNDDAVNAFVSHSLQPPDDECAIVIEFAHDVSATVYVTVDQSENVCY